MSCFDSIYCEMELPGSPPNYLKKCPSFQTCDLGKAMNEYIISKDGELLLDVSSSFIYAILKEVLKDQKEPEPSKVFYKRKKITMYASNCVGGGPRNGEYVYYTEDGSDIIDVDYVVQIRNGIVSSIKEISRRVKPALPISERD